jgi:hypothetical protein
MKNKNIVVLPKTDSKKPDVNVNTYMKKSKRNKEDKENKENKNVDIITLPDIMPDIEVPMLTEPTGKALNLIKARNTLEEKINNLINEIKSEELVKINIRTEKLRNKLLKLI